MSQCRIWSGAFNSNHEYEMSSLIAAGFAVEAADGRLSSLSADLRAVVDLGADAVELTLTSLDLIAGGRMIEERVAPLLALTRQFDVTYTAHGLVSSNFMDPDTLPSQLQAAKALVELCDRIGARVLVQHGGFLRADQIHQRADAVDREREALHELCAYAARHGVRIALENIFSTAPGQYRQTPAEIAGTVKAVNHPALVALIDFSHAYLEATYRGLDFMAEIAAMAPVAGHLHVHDSFGRPKGFYEAFFPQEAVALGIGDLHLPLGWGDIAWERIFSELRFLPGTVLMMEIGERYRQEQPASLAFARQLMSLSAKA